MWSGVIYYEKSDYTEVICGRSEVIVSFFNYVCEFDSDQHLWGHLSLVGMSPSLYKKHVLQPQLPVVVFF